MTPRFAVSGVVLLAGCTIPEAPPFVDWLPGDRPVVVAHRGGAHLAPENTLTAFHRSAEEDVQAEVIEIDIHATSDGVPVVLHDATVDRTTGEGAGCDSASADGTVAVAELTLAELQALDAGFCFTDLDGANSARGTGVTVPTLREALEELPGRRFLIEFKATGEAFRDTTLELLTELGAFERTCLFSFDDAFMAELHEVVPEGACVGLSAAGARCFAGEDLVPFGGVPCDIAHLASIPAESAPFDLRRGRLIANMQSYGMPVFMYTLNDADTILSALQVGVNGVITDRPDIARARIGALVADPDESTE